MSTNSEGLSGEMALAEYRLSVTFFSLPTKAATVWTEDRHKIVRQSVALQHAVDGGNGQLDRAGMTECFSRDVLITSPAASVSKYFLGKLFFFQE